MESSTPGSNAGDPPKKKNHVECPEMYPGFGGSLLARQMNPNPPPFTDERAEPKARLGDGDDHKQKHVNIKATQEEDNHQKTGAEKAPPGVDNNKKKGAEKTEKASPSRKRRRRSRSSSKNTSHSADNKHHDNDSVHHVYHDYSGLSGGPVSLPTLAKKGRGGVSSMFPTVLHHMLEDAGRLGFGDVVSWQPHGRAFHVNQPEKFVLDVMPKYFRHTPFVFSEAIIPLWVH